MSLEINDQFKRALDLMEQSDKHLFITGRAGTGKSTLLDYFRNNTKKNIAVLAPTGVAAVNVRGQTIHSFFGFKPDVNPDLVQKVASRIDKSSIYKDLDAIIIDEISMVRADLLDCVDKFLRLNGNDKYRPFGGIQMILIGDLYQLPPVVTPKDREYLAQSYVGPYFFDAGVFSCLTLEVVELEKIYRQKDASFITLLNRIRDNMVSQDELNELNRAVMNDPNLSRENFTITLTTTNALADEINDVQLDNLPGEILTYEGIFSGDFLSKDTPTHADLSLKIGAQVMLLNNDVQKRWVNGTIGKIISIDKGHHGPDILKLAIAGKGEVEVVPHTWEQHRFDIDKNTHRVDTRIVGSFTQYPVKLAWAVTIHKSQGKTFDQVVIDIGRGTFAHGQMYVALSRCTTLEGIILKRPILKRHIIMDSRVHHFMSQFCDSGTYRGEQYQDQPQQMSF